MGNSNTRNTFSDILSHAHEIVLNNSSGYQSASDMLGSMEGILQTEGNKGALSVALARAIQQVLSETLESQQSYSREEIITEYSYNLVIGDVRKDVSRQLDTLRSYDLFSKLDPDIVWKRVQQLDSSLLPSANGFEGLFVSVDPFTLDMSYVEAINSVASILAGNLGTELKNYISAMPGIIRQTSRTVYFESRLRNVFGSGFWLEKGQLGRLYAGKSVNRAQHLYAQNSGEYGVGIFRFLIWALTHPERFDSNSQLAALCLGDEYSQRDGESYNGTPCVSVHEKEIMLGMKWKFQFFMDAGGISASIPE